MIKNKRGSELVSNKLIIIILAILVIAVILFFIFKANILEWMRNLPEWQYEGDKDVEVSGEDRNASESDCPIKVARAPEGKEIFFCGDKACSESNLINSRLYIYGESERKAEIYVLLNGYFGIDRLISDEKIGDIENKKITILPEILEGKGAIYEKVKNDLPNFILLLNLNEAYFSYQNYICRKERPGKDFDIEGVGKGKLIWVKGECMIFFEKPPLDSSKMEFFKIYGNRLHYSEEGNLWADTHYLVIEENFEEFEKQKEAYDKLSSVMSEVIFKGKEIDEQKAEAIFVKPTLTIFFKIDGVVYDTFIKWEGKKWYIQEKEEWKPQNWDYEEAYAEIRKYSEGTFYDNEIYWKTKEEAPYELIPGMIGDTGEIDSVEDFYNFRVWFDKFVDNLEEKEKIQGESFSEFKEEIEKRTINIDGKEEKLGVDYIIYPTYSLPLVYFSPENKKYGIIYKEPTGINHLWLAEYSKSENRWNEISHPFQMWPVAGDEDLKKATKIFNFLKQECPK